MRIRPMSSISWSKSAYATPMSMRRSSTLTRRSLKSSRRGAEADSFVLVMGSWKFMIVQSLILAAWIVANVMAWVHHWDPYPFILLNLALSFQAAYAAPIIMMSQNRQAAKDRLAAEQDYLVNTMAEEEVKASCIMWSSRTRR
jgi:uncharacterized membrane protein